MTTSPGTQGGPKPAPVPRATPDRDLVVEMSWCMNCGCIVAIFGTWRHLLVNGRVAPGLSEYCDSEDVAEYRRDGAR